MRSSVFVLAKRPNSNSDYIEKGLKLRPPPYRGALLYLQTAPITRMIH
jgi:hypothetical protein